MPLYEYRCQRCDRTFEVLQKFSDKPLAVHEGCGGLVERLLSAPALQFKGTGWYVTDYGRNGGGASKDASSGDVTSKTGTKSESKTETKTETKPAAKTKT